MSEIAVLLTESVIIASGVYSGKTRHVTIPSSNPVFKKAVEAYKNGNHEDIIRLGDVSANIEEFSDGLFYVSDGLVFTENMTEPAPKILSQRIIKFAKEDLPVQPLLNFWDKLSKCPSESVREQLYNFLEHNNIPITSDGCFVAYKSVTRSSDGDLWDTYTFNHNTEKGTYRNNVGDVPEMSRDEVNDDPTQTCSHGLHVAAHNYAQNNYGFGDNKVVVHVKVEPENVVSVPNDYNGQKMRVCKYEVIAIAEDENPIEKPLYDDSYEPEVDLQDEDDLYDATEDVYEEEDIVDETETSACEDCEDYDCPDHPSNQTTTSIVVYSRNDGSLEIPVEVVRKMGIGTPVQIISDENTNTVRIVPSDEEDARTLRKGMRISRTQLDNADIFRPRYMIEYSANIISISEY